MVPSLWTLAQGLCQKDTAIGFAAVLGGVQSQFCFDEFYFSIRQLHMECSGASARIDLEAILEPTAPLNVVQ